jgi:hypothetical protein
MRIERREAAAACLSHAVPGGTKPGGEHFAEFIYYVRSNSIFEARLTGAHVMRSFWQRASSIDQILLLALPAGAAFTLNGIWWGGSNTGIPT